MTKNRSTAAESRLTLHVEVGCGGCLTIVAARLVAVFRHGRASNRVHLQRRDGTPDIASA
jgi:hypothetical protein